MYQTTVHNATSETPYLLAFGAEAVVPMEISLPNCRIAHFSQEKNDDILGLELDLLKGKKEKANLRAAAYEQCLAQYYNSKVKNRIFSARDLVLGKVMQNIQELNTKVLSLNWEGPYW